MKDLSLLAWKNHYTKEKSRLVFPDENVVRFLNSKLPNNKYVLDLGCGPGRHSALAYDMGYKVTGCDFVKDELVANKKYYAKKKIEWLQADVLQLPFNKHTFDLILCWGVLHYVELALLPKAIKNIFNVVKKRGTFFASLRAKEDTHLSFQTKEGDLMNSNHNYFSKEQVYDLFSEYGDVKVGYILRTPIGSTKTLAHHMVEVAT